MDYFVRKFEKMKFFRSLLSIIIFFIVNYLVASENVIPKLASITGVVVDHLSGNPIEYANLVLYRSLDSSMITGTVSSAEGRFAMEKLDNGVYSLKVHFMGYQTLEVKNIEVDKGMTLDLGVLRMESLSINLAEAEVVANNDYVRFKVDKQVINVSAQAGAEGGMVADALANVPAVQVDGAGNITLRGSTSFTVLIDGRPTVLDATETLNQTPANAVEKIEIITNPGVKYDADGTTGIINLIMKKQKSNGTSAQATLTLATGDKYTTNVMVNHRGKTLTSYLNATYSNKRKQTQSTDSREAYTGDTTQNQFIASDRDLYWRNYQVSGGFSLNPNDKNTWSLDAEVGEWEFDRRINSNMQTFNSYSPDTNRVGMVDRFLITNAYVSGNAGYSRLFSKDDNKLDINLYYVYLGNGTPNQISENYSGALPDPDSLNELQLNSRSNRNQIRLNVDYTLPLSEILMFETGWQSEGKFSGTDYEYLFYFPDAGKWTSDSSMTDRMDYRQTVNGLYAMLGIRLKGISIKGGLRAEMNNRLLTEKLARKTYQLDEINWFPSLHVSHEMKHGQQLSLSYSRRVNRPNEWMLIPAVSSTGRNMLQVGNPELLPDFTHSIQTGYALQNDVVLLSTELFTRITTNSIVNATTERNGVYYQSYENLRRETATGLELMTNINLKPWWRMNLNASAYYNTMKGTLKTGYLVDNQSFMWNGSFRTTFIVKKTYLEFLAIYYGPSVLAQGKSQDFYYFDVFLKRSFLNRSLTVALRSHNTFDSGIYIEDSQGTNFKAHTWFKYEGPTFMMTLTYKFNNFKRQKTTDSPDMNFDSGLDH